MGVVVKARVGRRGVWVRGVVVCEWVVRGVQRCIERIARIVLCGRIAGCCGVVCLGNAAMFVVVWSLMSL